MMVFLLCAITVLYKAVIGGLYYLDDVAGYIIAKSDERSRIKDKEIDLKLIEFREKLGR